MQAKHPALHSQMMKLIKESLAKTFDDKTSRDVLLSGDTVIQVCCTQKGSSGASSGGSSSSSALPEGGLQHSVRYFAVVAQLNCQFQLVLFHHISGLSWP